MQEKKIPKWRTKDGKVMEISDMDDRHLLNAQRMCRKTVCAFNDMLRCADHPILGPHGDGAQMAFEQELNSMHDIAAEHYFIEGFLDKEVKRRSLTPLELPPPIELPEIESVEHLEGGGTIFKLKGVETGRITSKKGEKKMTDETYSNEFFIAGVQFHQLKTIIDKLEVGQNFELVLEPSNKFDPNACRIEHFTTDHEQVMCGYVPKKFSAEVSALLSIGTPLECTIIELNRNAKPWECCKVEIKEIS